VPNIYSRNVSEALYLGLQLLKDNGEWIDSRSGRVIEYPAPVMTVYQRPEERVLFYPCRDANPFFHLFEALWMLAGRNDLSYVKQFNKRMEEFSDDGLKLNGAYGFRWRHSTFDQGEDYVPFQFDQLDLLVKHLTEHPESRRGVLQMWSVHDLNQVVENPATKDVPCNTQVYFKIKNNKLNMTVSCRSNDIIWGTYGANAVHFSILQEYMAARLGLGMGTYYHLSDSYHAYEKVYEKTLDVLNQVNVGDTLWYDSYLGWNKGMHYTPEPMFTHPKDADRDINNFVVAPFRTDKWSNNFFPETAVPMLRAWEAHQERDYDLAFKKISSIRALDWRKAGTEWLERREMNLKSRK
tara:strand:- start:3518 stop:4573 length:1056 start_codon:yes stop_codon:yes gene_type:complete